MPLPARGEPAAAPAPEPGVGDGLADLLAGHLKQGFLQSGIAVQGQIFHQVLGVAFAAVFQNHTELVFIEGDVVPALVGLAPRAVEQAVYHFAVLDRLFNDLVAVLHMDVGVEDVQGLDTHQGADLAKAVAAALFQVDAVGLLLQLHGHGDAPLFAILFQILVNIQRAVGDTAGTGTHQDGDPLLLLRQGGLGPALKDMEGFSCQARHYASPSFSSVSGTAASGAVISGSLFFRSSSSSATALSGVILA